MRRDRRCEILAATLALALLAAAGLALGSAAPTPASADESGLALGRATVVGELAQEHAVARLGTGAHLTVAKFVAVMPMVDAGSDVPVCGAGEQTPSGAPALCAPLSRSVRAPPAVSVG